jgi:hypothetical protein
MHPEIEKLIDLIIIDGQITEKVRNVILKKAAELSVDSDELEWTKKKSNNKQQFINYLKKSI